MRLEIGNFCGITSAILEIRGITLLCGENGAGKSSILRAAAACAGGMVIPMVREDGKDAILKRDTALLVQGKSGHAVLNSDAGSRRMAWPANGVKVTGEGPFPGTVSPMALGMVNWMSLLGRERVNLLLQAMAGHEEFSFHVTREDLEQAVAGENIPTERIDWIWKIAAEHSLDTAYVEAERAMTQATGGWRVATGENYGSQKAAAYRPHGWENTLATATMESLEAAVARTERQLERAIANQAVDEAEVARLREIAGRTPPDMDILDVALQEARRMQGEKIAALQQQLVSMQQEPQSITDRRAQVALLARQIDAKRQEISDAGAPKFDGICPACREKLRVAHDFGFPHPTHGRFQFAASLPAGQKPTNDQAEQTKRLDDLLAEKSAHEKAIVAHTRQVTENRRRVQVDIDAAMEKRRQAVSQAESAMAMAKHTMTEVQSAAAGLAELQVKGGGVSRQAVDAIRMEVQKARERLKASQVKQQADTLAEKASHFAALKVVLAPDGVRKKKMAQALEAVNRRLAGYCETAEWEPVALVDDGELLYQKRPYLMCSRGEQYRCRVTMQVLMSNLEQAPFLMMDGADILDSHGRYGLILLLNSTQLPCLVAMTAKKDYAEAVAVTMDDLVEVVYWIDNGVVSLLTHPSEEAPPEQEAQEPPELASFRQRLRSHDWFYSMADNWQDVKDGEKRRQELIAQARVGGHEFMRAFNEMQVRMWSRDGQQSKPHFKEVA